MQQKFLEFYVDEQFIRAPRYKVVGDSQDYLFARFSFGKAWQGLTKTAVFQAADGKAYHMLLQDDTCRIPAEVLRPTEFFVSVFGGERLTTDRAVVEVAASGFIPGIVPPPTTPDIYSQLSAAVGAQRELAESAAAAAEQNATLVSTLSAAVDADAAQAHADREAASASALSAGTAAESADAHARTAAVFAEQSQQSAAKSASSAQTATAAATAAAEDAAAALASAATAEQNAVAAAEQAQQIATLLPPKMRLINKVTLAEDVKEIAFTTDLDGKEIALKSACYLYIGRITKTTGSDNFYLTLRFNGGNVYQRYSPHTNTLNDAERFCCIWGVCRQVAPGLVIGVFPQTFTMNQAYAASDAVGVQGIPNAHSTLGCTFFWSPQNETVALKNPALLLRETSSSPDLDPHFLAGSSFWLFGEDYAEETVS